MDFDYVNTTEGPNCTQPAIDDFPGDLFTQEQRQAGAVVFHVTVSLYLFAALAVVCDKYFVPAVDIMCNALQMSNDVAGATFMAAATSAPELFVNVIGTFITEGDIGVGTVVGSAVFNILAVAACCGIGAGQVVPLDWWPLTRDCAAYGITVAILICIIHDERVEWYEALILVSLYVVYIAVMYFDKTLQKWARALLRLTDVQNRPSPDGTSLQSEQEEKNPGESYVMSPIDLQQQNGSIGWAPSIHSRSEVEKVDSIPPIAETCVVSTPAPKEHDTEIVLPKVDLISEFLEPREESVEKQGLQEAVVRALNAYDAHTEPKNLDKYVHDLFEWPSERGWFIQVRWIITWPIYLVFMFTIPDCQSNRFRNWYPVTFMMCIVWIGSLSYFVAWMITIIGHTLQIPDSVMGITFLAAGTSVPEAVSSVIVAKKGHGSMGISNSIGSNTFDILLCLGLPWLIKAALIPTIPGHHSVAINSSGLEYSAISLLSTLMMLYLAFFLNKFRLDQRVGRACLGMYAVFLILAILIELNVFFPVNLPTCAF